MAESPRGQAISVAKAVLGTIARGLWRAAVYLGPLLLAAAAYLGRLAVDAVHGVRVLLLDRRKRKAPERAADFDQIRENLRAGRAARWAAWRALPAQRRLAVRAASVAVLLAIVAILRARHLTPSPLASSQAAQDIQPTPSFGALRQSTPAPTVDLSAAAARFEKDARAAAPGQWAFLTEGPVLAPGPRGDFDDFTIASPWVLREVEGGTTRYRMWYRGCYFRGRDRGCAIGHATSSDGIRWQKTKGPVMVPADAVERRQLHGVTVARAGDKYFLWYSVAPDLSGPRRSSTLHLATSADGLRWEPAGQVLSASEQAHYALEPSALYDGRQFHLWFLDSLQHFEKYDFRPQEGAPFLMHFTSADGRTWEESGRFPLGPMGLERFRVTVEARPDAGFQAMFFEDYNDQWGRLVSADGNAWELDNSAKTALDRRSIAESLDRVTGAAGLEMPGGTLVWLVTTSSRAGREEIRVGFRRGA